MSVKSLRAALQNELERLRAIEQPSLRAQEVQKLQRSCAEFTVALAEVMRMSVREMREIYGHSWQDVADELHVSRARAQQIGG